MNKIPYLSPVECQNRLHRDTCREGRKWFKRWVNSKYRQPVKFNGVFLGYRTLQDGYLESDQHFGNYFVPEKFTQVALVSFSSTQNPVYVSLDRIRIIDPVEYP